MHHLKSLLHHHRDHHHEHQQKAGMTTMAEAGERDPPTWAELLGSHDWEGLLAPLDLGLRRLILRCGDFIQVTYDTFINDQNSKYCGCSRYGKANLFQKVMMENGSDYEVVSFLYGTARISSKENFLFHSQSREAWDRESNWIGYIAVTTDEVSKQLGRREIYVAWRGTTRNYEWINVMGAKRKSIEALLSTNNDGGRHELGEEEAKYNSSSSDDDEKDDDRDDNEVPKVMLGWYTIYTTDDPRSPFTKLSARTQLLTKINELREKYRGENLSVTFTGHSLGASLSILAAFDIVENGVRDIPVSAFVFGLPQVGNKAFAERCKNYPNLKFLHVRNTIDLIPHYPSKLLGYVDTGIELEIDTRKSPCLKDSKNPSDWHNLQAMLHIVAGWNGKDGEFELKVKRSLALVNKSCDMLKDECLVPPSWWVEKNKGMVLDEDGEWVMGSLADKDLPVPEY
ncbi:phospholipase A1-IIdelta [Rhodamnia argentea]|uniref:Phospholipase A1 n=1 Tax=Rhodamnia argentea TaxID=178133 RepID=A0A8B8NA68_9MYRT|nr:phospholipase A1-IIdelta [Rhodamnia argentea]